MNVSSILGEKPTWSPLAALGFTHPFFKVVIPTVVSTWVILGIICGLVFVIRHSLSNKQSHLRFCVLEGVRALMGMVSQSLGHFTYRHFSFIAAVFFFILVCNTVGVLPFLEEPTTNLNTTLALGLLGLLYRDFYAIKEHGLRGYLREFFEPLVFMFPLHVMGKFSSLISIAFRLFGNILGGAVISHLWFGYAQESLLLNIFNFLGVGLIINLFFGVFEGLVQAFVFAILSLTYLSLALAHEEKQQPINFEKTLE